jgi:hypothetical protein
MKEIEDLEFWERKKLREFTESKHLISYVECFETF